MKTEIKQKGPESGKEVSDLKNKEWKKQLPYIEGLKNEGGAKNFFGERNDLKEGFRGEYNRIVCMDGGVYMKKDGFPLAGLGILGPGETEEGRLENAADVIINSGHNINQLEVHSGCGAVKKACERDNPGEEPTDEKIKAKGKDWTDKLVKKLKSKNKEIIVRHILDKEMLRPIKVHNEVGLYYDLTGKFNPGRLKNIPQGFGINRGVLENVMGKEAREVKDYCSKALGLACEIAMGDHGFGRKRFTEKTPFTVFVVANNDGQLGDLKKEVENSLKDNKDFEEKRIIVDGFVAPEGL